MEDEPTEPSHNSLVHYCDTLDIRCDRNYNNTNIHKAGGVVKSYIPCKNGNYLYAANFIEINPFSSSFQP